MSFLAPKFLEFVKSYFTFMGYLRDFCNKCTNFDDAIESEIGTDTSTFFRRTKLDTDRTQLNSVDKVILESSTYGKFTRGEA